MIKKFKMIMREIVPACILFPSVLSLSAWLFTNNYIISIVACWLGVLLMVMYIFVCDIETIKNNVK